MGDHKRTRSIRACGNCPNIGIGYKKCSCCRLQRYCSKSCQQADWKRHKCYCKRLCALPPDAREDAHVDIMSFRANALCVAIRTCLTDLQAENKRAGNNNGVWLISCDDNAPLCWVHYCDIRQSGLEVLPSHVDIVQTQEKEHLVCGLVRNHRVLYVGRLKL